MSVAANAIGYIALTIMVVALVRKDSKHLLLMISGGVLLWAVHYGLLGSVPGAVVHVIAGVGIFIAHATYKARLQYRATLALAFSILGVGASIYSGLNAANITAAAGCVVMTASQYVLRGASMRQGFLAGEGVFFVFALLVGSIPGMLVTLCNALAGLIGLVRILREQAPAPDTSS